MLLCLKIRISSKGNESIKGLTNVLTHLKAYLINIFQLSKKVIKVILKSTVIRSLSIQI